MNEDNFKKLLDNALVPIKETLETLKSDVGTLKTDVGTLKSDVGTLKSDVGTLKSDVGTLKASVINMENTIKVYGDMYEINNDNARKLEKRIVTLEDKAGIEPPPELILLKVQ